MSLWAKSPPSNSTICRSFPPGPRRSVRCNIRMSALSAWASSVPVATFASHSFLRATSTAFNECRGFPRSWTPRSERKVLNHRDQECCEGVGPEYRRAPRLLYSCLRVELWRFWATSSSFCEGRMEQSTATGEDETGRPCHCLEVRIDIAGPPP